MKFLSALGSLQPTILSSGISINPATGQRAFSNSSNNTNRAHKNYQPGLNFPKYQTRAKAQLRTDKAKTSHLRDDVDVVARSHKDAHRNTLMKEEEDGVGIQTVQQRIAYGATNQTFTPNNTARTIGKKVDSGSGSKLRLGEARYEVLGSEGGKGSEKGKESIRFYTPSTKTTDKYSVGDTMTKNTSKRLEDLANINMSSGKKASKSSQQSQQSQSPRSSQSSTLNPRTHTSTTSHTKKSLNSQKSPILSQFVEKRDELFNKHGVKAKYGDNLIDKLAKNSARVQIAQLERNADAFLRSNLDEFIAKNIPSILAAQKSSLDMNKYTTADYFSNSDAAEGIVQSRDSSQNVGDNLVISRHIGAKLRLEGEKLPMKSGRSTKHEVKGLSEKSEKEKRGADTKQGVTGVKKLSASEKAKKAIAASQSHEKKVSTNVAAGVKTRSKNKTVSATGANVNANTSSTTKTTRKTTPKHIDASTIRQTRQKSRKSEGLRESLMNKKHGIQIPDYSKERRVVRGGKADYALRMDRFADGFDMDQKSSYDERAKDPIYQNRATRKQTIYKKGLHASMPSPKNLHKTLQQKALLECRKVIRNLSTTLQPKIREGLTKAAKAATYEWVTNGCTEPLQHYLQQKMTSPKFLRDFGLDTKSPRKTLPYSRSKKVRYLSTHSSSPSTLFSTGLLTQNNTSLQSLVPQVASIYPFNLITTSTSTNSNAVTIPTQIILHTPPPQKDLLQPSYLSMNTDLSPQDDTLGRVSHGNSLEYSNKNHLGYTKHHRGSPSSIPGGSIAASTTASLPHTRNSGLDNTYRNNIHGTIWLQKNSIPYHGILDHSTAYMFENEAGEEISRFEYENILFDSTYAYGDRYCHEDNEMIDEQLRKREDDIDNDVYKEGSEYDRKNLNSIIFNPLNNYSTAQREYIRGIADGAIPTRINPQPSFKKMTQQMSIWREEERERKAMNIELDAVIKDTNTVEHAIEMYEREEMKDKLLENLGFNDVEEELLFSDSNVLKTEGEKSRRRGRPTTTITKLYRGKYSLEPEVNRSLDRKIAQKFKDNSVIPTVPVSGFSERAGEMTLDAYQDVYLQYYKTYQGRKEFIKDLEHDNELQQSGQVSSFANMTQREKKYLRDNLFSKARREDLLKMKMKKKRSGLLGLKGGSKSDIPSINTLVKGGWYEKQMQKLEIMKRDAKVDAVLKTLKKIEDDREGMSSPKK